MLKYSMFSLRRPPLPDKDTLTAATGKIVEGLLLATPEVTQEHLAKQRGSVIEHPPFYTMLAGGVGGMVKLPAYKERKPPSTFHHSSLSTVVELTPAEVAIAQHIVKALSKGCKEFQLKNFDIRAEDESVDLHHVAGNKWCCTLQLSSLHSPDIFIGMLRSNADALKGAVARSAARVAQGQDNCARR